MPLDLDPKRAQTSVTVFLGTLAVICWSFAFDAFTRGTLSGRARSISIQEATGGNPANFGFGMVLLGCFCLYGIYRARKWLSDSD